MVRVNPRPAPRTPPALLRWQVPVLRMAPADAIAWLTSTESNGFLREGTSIRYLKALAQWAQQLTENGRMAPEVVYDAQGAQARWRPVLQGADVLHLQKLVAAMPPVCRAQPGLEDPHELTFQALSGMLDGWVRRTFSDSSLVPSRRGRRPKQLPAAEAWLGALTRDDGHFHADQAQLDALEESLRLWDEIESAHIGPARATFRLTEIEPEELLAEPADQRHGVDEGAEAADPAAEMRLEKTAGSSSTAGSSASLADNETRWHVEFLLQSTADPSLLVPADQVWTDDGTLKRWLDTPQELLLEELGRASSTYPALATALRQARPNYLEIDTDGAFEFLVDAADALNEAGFGVLLPSWWDGRRKLGLKLSASTPTDTLADTEPRFGRDQLCEFQWKLAVGDEELTEEEITALAEVKAPLVRLRGQWVSVNSEQLRRGLEFLETDQSGKKSVAEVLSIAATHPDDLDTPLEVVNVEADGWLGAFLDGSAAQTIEPVTVPDALHAQLRPYQQRGLSWLNFLSSLGLGACLADDMGLGKTIQLLSLELRDRAEDPEAGPTLLLCPMSVVGNWQREAAKFAPDLKVYAHHGASRLPGEALRTVVDEVDLVVTTYGTAMRDIEDLAEISWNRLVLDEAQAIKNSLSRTSKTVRRLQASHRVALTGTPIENRLSEMWSIMDFLNPGILSSQQLFRTRYAIPVERHDDDEAARRLRTITRPYVLRRSKTDPTIIDDLPEKIEIKQYCRLSVEQASLYQSVVNDMMDKIADSDGIERRGNVLAAMAKLKQVCNHPAQLLHDRSAIGTRSGKISRLEEVLEEILTEGDRVLCFTQYTEFAEMLLPHLAARFNTDVGYLHGGTSRKHRDEMVAQFQAEEGPPIFLLSLKAGGTGLNLTAANHVIHLDRWWNPAVENQATDRAFRIGQKRSVQVHKFISTGTLEEKIDDMIEQKKALANLVVSDDENWMTEFSTDDLRELFTLSEGAVGE